MERVLAHYDTGTISDDLLPFNYTIDHCIQYVYTGVRHDTTARRSGRYDEFGRFLSVRAVLQIMEPWLR